MRILKKEKEKRQKLLDIRICKFS